MSRKIPTDFYSYMSDEPFDRCIECNRNLLAGDIDYVIEKAIQKHPEYRSKEVIFDYAICMNCAMDVRKQMSKESLFAIENYFMNNLSPDENLLERERDMLSTCLIKRTKVDDLNEYQIYAHCKGSQLKENMTPYLISGDVIEEIIPLISNKTNDILNGFIARHFSPDPSLTNPIPKLVLL